MDETESSSDVSRAGLFKANKTELDFQREYNLSKKPLRIDLLVVEKLDDVSIENEIGRIFRKEADGNV